MAQNLIDNWQTDKILTANWNLQPPIQTLSPARPLKYKVVFVAKLLRDLSPNVRNL